MSLSASPEVAALAAPYCLHPTGRPFYVENFISGGATVRGWNFAQSGGGGGGLTLVQALPGAPAPNVYNGNNMARLASTGIASGFSLMDRAIGLPSSKRIGLEANIGIPQDNVATLATFLDAIEFVIEWRDGTNFYRPRIGFFPPSDSIFTSDGVAIPNYLLWSVFSGGKAMFGGTTWMVWNNFKIIADFNTLKIEKAYFNQYEWTPNQTINRLSTINSSFLQFMIQVNDIPTPAGVTAVYIGNVICTFE